MPKQEAVRQRICNNVAKLLRAKREELGLSLTEVAARAGLSRQMIAFVENGQRNPTLETLLRMTDALDENLEDLLRKARSSQPLKA